MRFSYQFVGSACALSVAAIGLSLFTGVVQRSASMSEGPVDRSVSLGCEFQLILAPQALIDFAKKHSSISLHEELASLLEKESLSGVWYATVAREVLSTGESCRNVNYVYPGRMDHTFPSTKAVLEALAGGPSTDGANAYAKAKIGLVPANSVHSAPDSIVPDLMEKYR